MQYCSDLDVPIRVPCIGTTRLFTGYDHFWCQNWPTMVIDPNREHEYLRACSNEELCHYLATKVRQWRRTEGLSQVELALRAEVPLRTYKRFESHGKANLETFVQVLRALGRTQYLFMLFPMPVARKPTFDERLKHLTPTKFRE